MKELEFEIGYHKNQEKIFFESGARFKVIAKGRRFGLTRGFANYIIEQMLDGDPVSYLEIPPHPAFVEEHELDARLHGYDGPERPQ